MRQTRVSAPRRKRWRRHSCRRRTPILSCAFDGRYAYIITVRKPKICAQCGGKLEPKTITHQQPWGGELYEFENVPALVCRQCGEVDLRAEVTQLIDVS